MNDMLQYANEFSAKGICVCVSSFSLDFSLQIPAYSAHTKKACHATRILIHVYL